MFSVDEINGDFVVLDGMRGFREALVRGLRANNSAGSGSRGEELRSLEVVGVISFRGATLG